MPPVLEDAFIEDDLLVMQFDEVLSPGTIKVLVSNFILMVRESE